MNEQLFFMKWFFRDTKYLFYIKFFLFALIFHLHLIKYQLHSTSRELRIIASARKLIKIESKWNQKRDYKGEKSFRSLLVNVRWNTELRRFLYTNNFLYTTQKLRVNGWDGRKRAFDFLIKCFSVVCCWILFFYISVSFHIKLTLKYILVIFYAFVFKRKSILTTFSFFLSIFFFCHHLLVSI